MSSCMSGIACTLACQHNAIIIYAFCERMFYTSSPSLTGNLAILMTYSNGSTCKYNFKFFVSYLIDILLLSLYYYFFYFYKYTSLDQLREILASIKYASIPVSTHGIQIAWLFFLLLRNQNTKNLFSDDPSILFPFLFFSHEDTSP